MNHMTFKISGPYPSYGPDGTCCGEWAIIEEGGIQAGVQCLWGRAGEPGPLVEAITKNCQEREVLWRMSTQQSDDFASALTHANWKKRGIRLQWKIPLQKLPQGENTPFLWKSAHKLPTAVVLPLLEAVVQGDPLGPSRGTPKDWLQMWQERDALKGGLWVGFLDGNPVAVTGAQVATNGWCRIPYNGLLPILRGKGYGKQVLLQGFRLLRLWGGSIWHGSCATQNTPVLRLIHSFHIHPEQPEIEWLCP